MDPKSIHGYWEREVNRSISDRLKTLASDCGDKNAVIAPGRQPLSFVNLWKQIDYVVNWLNATNLGRNDRIALVLPNGPEMAVGFIAVASGATAAPLNPNSTQSEFEFYLSDLKAKAIIVQSNLKSAARTAAEALDIPIVELSFDKDAPAGSFTLTTAKHFSRSVRHGFAEEDDTALVLHTSGTTSRPKIVPLTHRNLCASIVNHKTALALTPMDCCLGMMPLFHIHGLITVVLSSLMTGGSVVCAPGFDAAMFFKWVEEFRPTWFTAAPALYQALLAYVASPRSQARDSSLSLRFLRSAAAPLSRAVLDRLKEVFMIPVIESYGMTEAAAQITSNPLPPHRQKTGSVGLAAGPQVAVMDQDGNILPAEKTGEIVIRGASVMAGYEDNPEANNGSFVNGWFRTGDEGFVDGDGYFFITGRLKEIINRGGEKVSPREIDEVFMDHSDVIDAATFAVPHPSLGQDIVTAVVLGENAAGTERELREFAVTRLSSHKTPSRVLIVDKIPKGPTGKLQRARIAEALAPKLMVAFTPAKDPIQNILADIWKEVLEIERVGIHDNFISIGGDSLMAMRVLARIESRLNLRIPVVSFFHSSTIAEIAALINDTRKT